MIIRLKLNYRLLDIEFRSDPIHSFILSGVFGQALI